MGRNPPPPLNTLCEYLEAAGEFTLANGLRAACPGRSPILTPGLPHVWVSDGDTWMELLALCRPTAPALPGKQFPVHAKRREILTSNHCRHPAAPRLTQKASRTPYPHSGPSCTGIFIAFLFPVSFSCTHIILHAAWKNNEVPSDNCIISSAKCRLAFSDDY